MNTKIAAVIGFALIGAAFALQLSHKPAPVLESRAIPQEPAVAATPVSIAPGPAFEEKSTRSLASHNQPVVTSSSAVEVIAKIKEALSHPGSRHAYATFSRLSETVDASNVREVLAFVQTLPKPQEKSMLISLFVARWAELDAAAALAYAEALPSGTTRNWALTSAVGGWPESYPAAATAWVQQLPIGPLRDQAMQTVVSALADADPQNALAFLENLPPGRNKQSLYWPVFSRW